MAGEFVGISHQRLRGFQKTEHELTDVTLSNCQRSERRC